MPHDPNRTRAEIPLNQVFDTYHDWHTEEVIKALDAEHDCVVREVFTEGEAHWHSVRWTVVLYFSPSDKSMSDLKRVAFIAVTNLFPGVYRPTVWVEDRNADNPRAAVVLVRWFAGGAAALSRTPRAN
jgi:UV DNA damage repair endonuclease